MDYPTFEFDGKCLTAPEWAKITGVPAKTIRSRLNRGWTLERTLTEPPRVKEDTVTVFGVAIGFQQALDILQVSHQAVYKQAGKQGITPAEEIVRRFDLQPEKFPNHLRETQ